MHKQAVEHPYRSEENVAYKVKVFAFLDRKPHSVLFRGYIALASRSLSNFLFCMSCHIWFILHSCHPVTSEKVGGVQRSEEMVPTA